MGEYFKSDGMDYEMGKMVSGKTPISNTCTHAHVRMHPYTDLRSMSAVLFEHDVGKGVVFSHVNCSAQTELTLVVDGVYGWEAD